MKIIQNSRNRFAIDRTRDTVEWCYEGQGGAWCVTRISRRHAARLIRAMRKGVRI